MELTYKNYVESILAALLLILVSYISYKSFYMLFVFETGVSYPWLRLKEPGLSYYCYLPTISFLVIFLSSLPSGVMAIMICFYRLMRPEKKLIRYWLVLLAGLGTMIISCCVVFVDMLFNAGEFG